MGLINIPDETDLTTADANDLNSRFAIVTGLVNGNIDNANIKTGGVATSNLASQSVTTSKVADAAITPQQFVNPYKFAAYRNAAWTAPVGTGIVPFDAEQYDASNMFNTSTYTFTSTLAGYYHFSWVVACGTAGGTYINSYLVLGGGLIGTRSGSGSVQGSTGGYSYVSTGSCDMYMPIGATAQIYMTGNGNAAGVGADSTAFYSHLISVT